MVLLSNKTIAIMKLNVSFVRKKKKVSVSFHSKLKSIINSFVRIHYFYELNLFKSFIKLISVGA